MMFERFSKNGDWLEKMGVTCPTRKAFDETGAEDAPQPAADLLALVPGDAAIREGDVREPGPGSEQAVVGPGREVPALKRPTAATSPTTPARSTSSRAPAYYHNYMMGAAVRLPSCTRPSPATCCNADRPGPGRSTPTTSSRRFHERARLLPGRSLSWNELTKHATGEELNAKAFAAEFGAK